MTTGQRIRMLRKERGMTQGELGEKLGLSKSAVGMYEQDRRGPDRKMLTKLCQVFGVSGDFFLRESAEGPKEVDTLLADLRGELMGPDGLMFNGEPLTRDEAEQIAEAVDFAVRYAIRRSRDSELSANAKKK